MKRYRIVVDVIEYDDIDKSQRSIVSTYSKSLTDKNKVLKLHAKLTKRIPE
jgi:hypothetical protein